MSTKIQGATLSGIYKKIRCPFHSLKYRFKCEYSGCESPFICGNLNCIEQHTHNGMISMSKFVVEEVLNKFEDASNLVSDGVFFENAKVMKTHIEELRDCVRTVFKGITSISNSSDFLKRDMESPLTLDFIGKVQENYLLNQTIRKNMEELKTKTKLEFPVKDSYFALRTQLIENITNNISGFNWSKCREVHSSKNQPITCQKFHEKLYGKSDLLFIFVGENKIVGSYYSRSYPSLLNPSIKDPQSFLFYLSKQDDNPKFLKFTPNSEAESHMIIDVKNYICHGNTPSYGDGIRTFHKNFDSVEYCLPSNTYSLDNSGDEILSGTLKTKRFMILEMIESPKLAHIEEISNHTGSEVKENGVNPDYLD